MLSKLPEQDSNLRPPALESPSNGSLTTPYVGEVRAFAPDSQADGVKSDTEPATKSQSMLGYCDLCGGIRTLTPLGRGSFQVWLCDECHDEEAAS